MSTGHPTASWYELCMDTTGGETLGRFWAEAIGAQFRPDDAAGDVVSSLPGGDIAMCTVPEAKTVKHRVHLDIYAASLDDLVARGASVVLPAEESGLRWTVMRDPEGGEFCAFLRPAEDLPDYRLHGVVVDSADPEELATWWGDVLGVAVDDNDGRGFWTLTGVPGMPITTMDFVPVPEPKTVKNRIHWDVYSTVEEMTAKGARLLRARDEEISWDVMADPEGNEFCVFDRISS
ncbi:MAG TPA: VOC family protein [Nocardioidaceae bacterium]|nr:VOC family protein [Nocardioidaceae bacterium]